MIEFYRAARLQTVDADALLSALPLGDEPSRGAIDEEYGEADRALRARYRSDLPFPVVTAFVTGESRLLYQLVRRTHARNVMESGVANGHSSFLLLDALRRNGEGRLTSIDIERSAGALVPAESRARWDLHILPARRRAAAFAAIVASRGTLDLFLHDSDHSYDWQMHEFRTVWDRLTPNGWLVADDIDWSWAFLDFARKVGRRPLVLVAENKVFGLLPRTA